VVYALQDETDYDQLVAVPVLLPALTSTTATSTVAGSVRVAGLSRACRWWSTPVAVAAAAAAHGRC